MMYKSKHGWQYAVREVLEGYVFIEKGLTRVMV